MYTKKVYFLAGLMVPPSSSVKTWSVWWYAPSLIPAHCRAPLRLGIKPRPCVVAIQHLPRPGSQLCRPATRIQASQETVARLYRTMLKGSMAISLS